MRVNSLVRLVALVAVVALAVPAVAKPVTKSINLTRPAKLGSTQLDAGEYHLIIDENKVTVQRNAKTVAEVEGRWEQREQKSPYNSVLLGPNGELKEIRFSGEKRVLVIAAP